MSSLSPAEAREFPEIYCGDCEAAFTELRIKHVGPDESKDRAGRPYLYCPACGPGVITFLDARGISEENPRCSCELYSRLERSSDNFLGCKIGQLCYVCSFGCCGFHVPVKTRDGRPVMVTEDLIELYVAQGIL